MRCELCGEEFDPTNLGDVCRHFHTPSGEQFAQELEQISGIQVGPCRACASARECVKLFKTFDPEGTCKLNPPMFHTPKEVQ